MIRLLCGEDRHQITVKATGDGLAVQVGGTTLDGLHVEEVGPGRFVLHHGTRVEPFACVRDGDRWHLFWQGVAYELREEREGERRVQRHQGGGLEAPMPGKVIKVSVAEGQEVRKGDEILVIEAMKMENAVRAPRDGTVQRISAAVGDMVNPGVVLVDLA